ncbi:MAG TPA: ABC transporter ATP-binding protein [Streptosporangiaceae bacterium]|jgi:ABC-2 type transport system ATP-binding protein|nr:ABC transporter ATP-binding protein [Streptosporangiaceae bacterium]
MTVPGSRTGATLAAESLTAGYGSRAVIKDVSLGVSGGKVLAIVGLNGAGKTTLLRVLAGLKSPMSGRVLINGADVYQRTTSSDVALVLQNIAIDRQLSGREYLEFAGRARGFSKASARSSVSEVIDELDLGAFADRRGGQLSGGQARRLQLGGSLVRRPRVLLLDEPTTGLDPSARRGYWAVIRQLASNGLTLVMVTHHIDEANLADEVLVLADGRVVSSGHPRDLVGQSSLSVVEFDFNRTGDAEAVYQHLGSEAADRTDAVVSVTTTNPAEVLSTVEKLRPDQDFEVRMRPAALDDLLVHLAKQGAGRIDG